MKVSSVKTAAAAATANEQQQQQPQNGNKKKVTYRSSMCFFRITEKSNSLILSLKGAYHS